MQNFKNTSVYVYTVRKTSRRLVAIHLLTTGLSSRRRELFLVSGSLPPQKPPFYSAVLKYRLLFLTTVTNVQYSVFGLWFYVSNIWKDYFHLDTPASIFSITESGNKRFEPTSDRSSTLDLKGQQFNSDRVSSCIIYNIHIFISRALQISLVFSKRYVCCVWTASFVPWINIWNMVLSLWFFGCCFSVSVLIGWRASFLPSQIITTISPTSDGYD